MTTSTSDDLRVPQFNLGDRLGKSLSGAGISVGDAAEHFGVARQTVGNWINSRFRPNRAVLMQWALMTAVPLEWLETGKDPRVSEGPSCAVCAIRDLNPEPADSELRAVAA